MGSLENNAIATLMYKYMIHKYKGQQFEDFFVAIMCKANPNFHPVKAYGNTGDEKNDGFDRTTGTYYQAFSPEDITKTGTISDAVEKLKTDFKGLYSNWNDVCPIKKYFFVINDKYQGLPPQIEKAILELDKDPLYSEVEINSFISNDLQKIFENLEYSDKLDIVGFIPSAHISLLEYNALQDTINYLMKAEIEVAINDELVVPDFDKKIEFNGLSKATSRLLETASFQEGSLIKFFKENVGLEEIIQGKFKSLYDRAKKEFDDSCENYGDQRFIYILNEANPNNSISVKTSIMILMAHYFSSCDIFEKPV